MRRARHATAAPASSPRHGGFTLIELLTTLGVLAVLGMLAAPSLVRLTTGQRLKNLSGDLYTTLVLARSEAIKRNANVSITPARAGQWQYGWSIGNPSDALVKLHDHAAMAAATIDGPASVVYQADGRVKGAIAPSFDIAMSGTDMRLCVLVDLSGRPYQKSTAC